ncbi:MAG: alcohol dehydrogenase catalytic domain-containing protein [Candidatus Eisenbacteria bacterium]|nr:alcohol dehydrogenase catalytic domain-containing protein [Candidatus Eisenbacteria bacterium]
MQAMVLEGLGRVTSDRDPLVPRTVPDPEPADGELLLEVTACGVCHTELDEIEGRTPPPELPVILGHQVVGRVTAQGRGVSKPAIGDRVGVAWIYSACGHCYHCRRGEENLCPGFRATGRDADGGYAERMRVPADFVYAIPERYSDAQAAPLLCAGAIGYRSLRLTELKDGERLGLTGFGASAHLVLKMAQHRFPRSEVYVFSRSEGERAFARELGAGWAGAIEARAPARLHRIIDTTPAWKPVVEALANLEPGGRLVINAIRKESQDQDYLQRLDYERDLWMEKEIKSVANVARRDVREFLTLADETGMTPEVTTFGLREANRALQELRARKIRGAKVLEIGG